MNPGSPVEKSETIYLEGIGLVVFSPSRRARHIVLSVSDLKGVRVAVPRWSSIKEALDYVHGKKGWVQRHLKKIKQDQNRKRNFEDLASTLDKVEAKRKLVNRVNQLAKEHGFTFNKVFVRNQRTRWGSCSPKNTISLNIKLVLLPEELIDYVMLHELVHTRVHNHSKRFWAELGRYVGDARSKAKSLRALACVNTV